MLGVEADAEVALDQLGDPCGGPQLGPPAVGLGPLQQQGLQLAQLLGGEPGLGAGVGLGGQLLGRLAGELDPGVDGGAAAAEEVGDVVGRFALLDEFDGPAGGGVGVLRRFRWVSYPKYVRSPPVCSVGQAGVSSLRTFARAASRSSVSRCWEGCVSPKSRPWTGSDDRPNAASCFRIASSTARSTLSRLPRWSAPRSAWTIVSVSSPGMPVSRSTSRRSSTSAGSSSGRLASRRFDATRFSRSGSRLGADLLRLEPQRRRRDLHGARVEVDAVEVVLEDALDDRAARPLAPALLAAMPRLFAVERDQQIERDHEEVARAHGGVEDLQVAHALRRVLHRVVRDRLRHVVGPAPLGVGVERHQLGERDLARLALRPPLDAPLLQRVRACRRPRPPASSRASCTSPATSGRGCSAAASPPCSAR